MARNKSSSKPTPNEQLILAKAVNIKLLLLDVDGVLTDGTLTYTDKSIESKTFHCQDGFGIRLLAEAGIDVGIISARSSESLTRRAEELNIRFIHQGESDKSSALRTILKSSSLKPIEIAYMGDDWVDLSVMQQVGLAVSPANGVIEVKEIAHYVTEKSGGDGAVRECCNLILRAQNKLSPLLQKYRTR